NARPCPCIRARSGSRSPGTSLGSRRAIALRRLPDRHGIAREIARGSLPRPSCLPDRASASAVYARCPCKIAWGELGGRSMRLIATCCVALLIAIGARGQGSLFPLKLVPMKGQFPGGGIVDVQTGIFVDVDLDGDADVVGFASNALVVVPAVGATY